MDPFEDQLRKLPLKKPNPDLHRKIDELLATPEPTFRARRSGIRWGWAAAACFLTGVLGFAAGRYERREEETDLTPPRPSTVVQVVYSSPGTQNPFDLTSVDEDRGTETWTWEYTLHTKTGDEP